MAVEEELSARMWRSVLRRLFESACWVLGLSFFPMIAAGQSSAPARYDLVSVLKPSQPGATHLRIRMDADAIFIQNASVADLLGNTFGIRNSLISGLPKWAESSHFDIQAKVISDDSEFYAHMTRAERREIFIRLLKERFGVETHFATRNMPVYELVSVGKGPGLIEDPPPSAGVTEKIAPGRNGRGNTSVVGTTLDATGVRIGDLCSNLAVVLDRNVIDRTQLTSYYDIQLHWADETKMSSDEDENAPSLFTAIQEQLGLKLVPSKAPVQVLVVDRASPPTLD